MFSKLIRISEKLKEKRFFLSIWDPGTRILSYWRDHPDLIRCVLNLQSNALRTMLCLLTCRTLLHVHKCFLCCYSPIKKCKKAHPDKSKFLDSTVRKRNTTRIDEFCQFKKITKLPKSTNFKKQFFQCACSNTDLIFFFFVNLDNNILLPALHIF